MKRYFSTFITGTQDIIREALANQIKAKIVLLLDGIVVYETKKSINEIKKIRFFNNTYLLIEQFEISGKNPIEQMIKEIIKIPDNKLKKYLSFFKKRTFKIVNSLENQTIKVDYSFLSKLEKKISQITDLRLNINKPDLEFIFLARREGVGFFGIRITYRSKYRGKGELRSELSNILCLISQPNKNDVVLDPFVGSGSIIKERVNFPYSNIIALDKNKGSINKLKQVLKDEKIEIKQGDALNSYIRNYFIDKIITDPPWGFFEKMNISLDEFYLKMLNEFQRILKDNGLAVILIGNKKVFEKSLEKIKNLYLLNRYDILVARKKAGIYVVKKIRII